MKSPVIAQTVESDLCIGCGICAAICPQNNLLMEWNKFGEYNPVELHPCTTDCGLCLKICPFVNHEENEDTISQTLFGNIPGIQHNENTGYYLETFVGYSETHRMTSASGGLATWLLESLLTQKIVDYVVCVIPTHDSDTLFSYAIFDDIEDLQKGSGSAYYPVEMSHVIQSILENPGRYAITGLPCFIKSIRLAQQRNRRLKERIVVMVGLTCGQLKSKHFTQYIAALAGVSQEVKSVIYRGKDLKQPANNYHYSFSTSDGKQRNIAWIEGISEAWTNRWFTLNACNYCDDIFAECADVSFMDAWLPGYSQDSRGTNLVITRSKIVDEVFQKGMNNGTIKLFPISVSDVVRSQFGVITIKRRYLAHRLAIYSEKSRIPEKRVKPQQIKNPLESLEIKLMNRMLIESKTFWNSCNHDIKTLKKKMLLELALLKSIKRILKVIMFPVKSVKGIWNKIRRN